MRHHLLALALSLGVTSLTPCAFAAEPAPAGALEASPAAEPTAPAPEAAATPTAAPAAEPTPPAPEPAAAPAVTPAPEPGPRVRRIYRAPATPSAPAAPARPLPFEISIAAESHVAASESLTPLAGEAAHLSATFRVGYAPVDFLDVYAGYRVLERLQHFDASGVEWRTDHETVLLGARLRLPLAGRWLKAFAQLDLEASRAELTMDLGSRSGRQATWSAGLTPEAGLEALLPLGEDVAVALRFGVGFALRLDHDFDDVSVATAAPAERPVDLGAANFSGLMVGLTTAIRF